jgi:hypothetical protein
LFVKEKLPVPLTREILMPLPKLNANKLLSILKDFWLKLKLNWPPLLRTSLSSPTPLKRVPLLELNKLPTTPSLKLNTKRPSTPSPMPSELLAIYNRVEVGSNLKVKLKKLLNKLNL